MTAALDGLWRQSCHQLGLLSALSVAEDGTRERSRAEDETFAPATASAYRFNRLPEAQQHAVATGFQGARFPWESALDGTEQIPPPASVNSEGVYEQHITADIALAQWQYYLVTGDAQWLKDRGWPVISGAAEFWASHATPGTNGSFHIDRVTGPDEENPNVNDEAYTNVAAKTTLQAAIQAAQVIGASAPANWSQIAAGLVVPVNSRHIHPEFSGYRNQLVQAGRRAAGPQPDQPAVGRRVT
jgi:trehalose/maltose hydrolase-like predicted phosphorylase